MEYAYERGSRECVTYLGDGTITLQMIPRTGTQLAQLKTCVPCCARGRHGNCAQAMQFFLCSNVCRGQCQWRV